MNNDKPYCYYARDVRVVDGDTLDVTIDLGFKISNRIRVRLSNVDTPEVYGVKKESDEYAKGIAAKKFVEALFVGAEVIIVRTYKHVKEKYGRYMADVFIDKGEQRIDLVEAILEAGHGVRSEG